MLVSCQEGRHRPALSLFAKVFCVFSCILPKVAYFQKFAFAKRSGAMKAPVGLLSDRTVLRSKMEGPRPDKFTLTRPRFCGNLSQQFNIYIFYLFAQYLRGWATPLAVLMDTYAHTQDKPRLELAEKIEANFYSQDLTPAAPQQPPKSKQPAATKITGKEILEAIRLMDAEERRELTRALFA